MQKRVGGIRVREMGVMGWGGGGGGGEGGGYGLKVGAVGFKFVVGSYRTDSKESPSFPLEERKVLVDWLHLVNWRFKIKQPSYYEHFPPFPSFFSFCCLGS